MFNKVEGYYRIKFGSVEIDRFYILSFKNARNPILLKVACKTKFLAKRFIMQISHPELYEVISGEDALEAGIRVTNKTLGKGNGPQKHNYPVGCNTWQKKKQHRTNFRDDLRRTFESVLELKQFTIIYRGKKYTIFEYTTHSAFKYLNKYSGMGWKHFISKLDTDIHKPKKDTLVIKSPFINMNMVNAYTLKHYKFTIKRKPNFGTTTKIESSFINIHKPKPKQLL